MKARDAFGVIIRTIGLLMVLFAFTFLGLGLLGGSIRLLLLALIQCALGVYLMRGAPHLLGFAYPSRAPEVPKSPTHTIQQLQVRGQSDR